MSDAVIQLRPGQLVRDGERDRDSDLEFILDSWLRSHRDSAWAKFAGATYQRGHDSLIKRLLTRSAVLVACYEGDPNTILGWSVTDGDVVHYVYVKKPLRRQGIARMLLRPFLDRPARYSHSLPCWASRGALPKDWSFDPYAMMVTR